MAEQHQFDRGQTEHVQRHGAEHAQAHGAEYVPGTMDITEHMRTFEGFIRFWVVLFGASAVILIFLAIFAL